MSSSELWLFAFIMLLAVGYSLHKLGQAAKSAVSSPAGQAAAKVGTSYFLQRWFKG